MNTFKLFAIAIGMVFAASFGYAGLIAPRSIADLNQGATLIVVASVSAAPPQTRISNSLLLRVNRVVKGDGALTGSAITVNWTPGSSNVGTGATGTGLWFLEQSPTGWTLMPVVQGNVPLSMAYFPTSSAGSITGAYAYGATASTADKLASEICFAIESSSGAGDFQLASLHYGILEELNSPVVGVMYQRMSTSDIPQHRALGLAGLIRLGNSDALTSASKAAADFASYPAENGILLLNIRDQFRATDGASVNALGQIAADTTTNQPFREAAAHALAAIHTKDSLPYLAQLLSDGGVSLRVEAIGGLSAFANGLSAQTSPGTPSLSHLQLPAGGPYQTAETIANFAIGSQAVEQREFEYLAFWKAWWTQQRIKLGY